MEKKVQIEGMSCEHCAHRIENSLKLLNGIQDVKVNLKEKEAVIDLSADLDENIIKERIEDLGFTVKSIHSEN